MHYPVLIAATHVKELATIQQTDTGIRVGASVTLATLDQALKQAIARLDGNVDGFLFATDDPVAWCVCLLVCYAPEQYESG